MGIRELELYTCLAACALLCLNERLCHLFSRRNEKSPQDWRYSKAALAPADSLLGPSSSASESLGWLSWPFRVFSSCLYSVRP